MAFDDLAKHMAARDGKQTDSTTDINKFMADAKAANARMNRQRDLILGPILLIGGVACLALTIVLLVQDRGRFDTGTIKFSAMLMAGAGAGIIVGGQKLIRGLRNKSGDDTQENEELVEQLQRRPLR